jgi:Flp pilus assembly protein TadD
LYNYEGFTIMKRLAFWNNWNQPFRSIYLVLLFSLLGVIVYTVAMQWLGLDIYAPFEVVRKTQSIEAPLHQAVDYIFNIPVNFRSYVVFQGFLNLNAGLSEWSSYLFLGLILLGFSLALSSATYLSRLWFIVFQSFTVIWIITLKFQYLGVFGLNDQTLGFVFIALFLVLGYTFHAFKEDTPFLLRWLAFAVLEALMFALIYWGADVPKSLLFAAHHGMIIPIVLSIIFIFNVGFEVILHILYFLAGTKQSDGKSTLFHFIVLSLLFIIYVALTFAHNSYLIRWDLIYLDAFFLLLIVAILGIWGFKKRSEMFESQLSFVPLGAYLYLALGIITFTTISWIFATANDPLVEAFEDVIIFSQLGFGIIFFFYVLYNFVALLREGQAVYKIVFKPQNVKFFLVRLIGLVVVVILVLRADYLPYYQVISGYYNGLADYYDVTDQEEAAFTTYKIARQYASLGHKANLKIAEHYYDNEDWVRAAHYYGQATLKHASPQAYIKRAQSQLNSSMVFEAKFTLEDALREFPGDARLANTQALVYEQLNQTDSTFIYLDVAAQHAKTEEVKEIAEANKIALMAKNGVEYDLVSQQELADKSIPYQANYMAYSNRKRQLLDSLDMPIASQDSLLTYNRFSWLFNYTVNQSLGNKPFTNDTLEQFIGVVENGDFRKSLRYASAVRENYAGEVSSAFSKVYELANDHIADAGFYEVLHGLWYYDQGYFEEATDRFTRAIELKVPEAKTYKVLSLIRAGNLFQARKLYMDQIGASSIDSSAMANDQLYQFLQGNTEALSDDFLYLWLHTNEGLTEEEQVVLMRKLEGTPYEALFYIQKANALLTNGKLEMAQSVFDKITLTQASEAVLSDFYALQLRMEAAKENADLTAISKEKLKIYPKNYQLFYDAIVARETKDTMQIAAFTEQLGMKNVFFEEGVLEAARYFDQQGAVQKAYDILVNAARVNISSVAILKAYALQALKVGLTSYARDAKEELALLLNDEEYETFSEVYASLEEERSTIGWE